MSYLLFSPSSGLPKSALFEIPHFDKVIHGTMFAILSFIYVFDSEKCGKSLFKSIALFLMLSLSFAALSAYIPGRYGNIYDLLSDAFGLGLGVGFYFLAGRRIMMLSLEKKAKWISKSNIKPNEEDKKN